jgi:hypothetical protein
MRSVLAVILITYLVGVGLILWPAAQSKWSVAPASDLSASIDRELPYALAWPVRVVHQLEARGRRESAFLRESRPPQG